ncbi:MAG: dehypoxanthine futalosine cyclase [Desulfobacteraceae bacterium 4572_87]|nr:MAG: dehypoxanthine futalosine cyclase [Desulfobacteraceae bacterium 4572_87]
MNPSILKDTIQKASQGVRLDPDQALHLYEKADFLTLGRLARESRFRHNPDPIATYAVDRNINYTNICVSGCAFCAFYKETGDPEGYVMDRDTLNAKCDETLSLGGTQILFQGGLNPDLNLDHHADQVAFMKSKGLHVHGFSPPEIVFMAQAEGMEIQPVIERLQEAGLGSIPGGGAEILVDRVRQKISPNKATTAQWLEVMEHAHELGLRTTATMMFGHIETPAERILHLTAIRELQEKTGGFTAFIPWPYQPGKNTLSGRAAGGIPYLRTLAISRIFLDNIPHIQASWVTQGHHIGQIALHFGADDMGSTMIEENVVASAGVTNRMTQAEIIRLIETAGFKAVQRNTLYEPVIMLEKETP